ncbi:MAG TPA: hypothetical protein VM052_02985 [Candidatus Limnocylindrales bacterium]|nr:hypothetical protein [Candidatus Limnocylindrales bacterium]
MADRMTPQDADLIAQRVVARLVRLVLAIGGTLLALWLLPVIIVYTLSSTAPGGPSWLLTVAVVGLAFFVGVVIVRFWSKTLHSAP